MLLIPPSILNQFLTLLFICLKLNLFASDNPPLRLLHGSITLLNTLTFLKYTAHFHCSVMTSSFEHSFRFLFLLLKYFILLILSLYPSIDMVEPIDLHVSDLLVSHYDCSEQYNLRQFSLTRVQPCAQAPSAFESTRAIANVFVRAKDKRLKGWTCEAYVKREKLVCAHPAYKYCRHDRTDYHQNTMQNPRTLDPTKCKHAIRHLNGTDNPQPNASDYGNSFTLLMIIKTNATLKLNNSLFV